MILWNTGKYSVSPLQHCVRFEMKSLWMNVLHRLLQQRYCTLWILPSYSPQAACSLVAVMQTWAEDGDYFSMEEGCVQLPVELWRSQISNKFLWVLNVLIQVKDKKITHRMKRNSGYFPHGKLCIFLSLIGMKVNVLTLTWGISSSPPNVS